MPTIEQDFSGKNMKNKIIGWTSVVGDLLHAGHHAMLKECKQHCDFLYCGLIADPKLDRPEKNAPVQSLFERYMNLEGCKYIDQVVPLMGEDDLLLALKTFPIDIRFVGSDYKEKTFTGKEYCESAGIKIFYNKRDHNFSSTTLRKRVKEAEDGKIQK